jgi:penicillin-binding protein 1A
MANKRPPPSDNINATMIVGGDSQDEDLVNTGVRKQAAPEPANDGATAFVRLDDVPQAPQPGIEDIPNDGATAFVRIDKPAPSGKGKSDSAPPPLRRAPPPSAPKKGLQVTLPDDEPEAPKPPPKAKLAPVAATKGRRGNWWDEPTRKVSDEDMQPETAPVEDAPAESNETSLDQPRVEPEAAHDGATAFVRVAPQDEVEPEAPTAVVSAKNNPNRKPKPKFVDEEIQVEAPKPKAKAKPKAAPEAYKPTAADDYQGHLGAGGPRWKVWLRRAVAASVLLAVLGVAGIVGAYFWISREIPPFESIRDYKPFVATNVVTEGGVPVGQFAREKRTLVPMESIPRLVVQAVTSAEDKDFYKHPGVNVVALVRAMAVNILSGRKRLGASTITQQVVKNMVLKSSDKKFKRKLKEILLAWRLESNLSKDDILYLYLNEIDFGRGHFGVEEAAQYYFGKHIADVDLGEAALLAGLPQNSSRLNPRKHPENAKRRQKYVLDRMLQNKMISKEDHDREYEKPLVLPPLPAAQPGGWYLDEVRRQLVAQYGEGPVETAGWTVEIAMDPRLQAAAEVAVQEGLRAVDKRQGWRGALFKIDKASINDFTNALGRRMLSTVPPEGVVLAADLDGVNEKEQQSLDSIARAAKLRPLVQGGIYAGVVTSVTAREARVLLAPGAEGWMPFSSMAWARSFSPSARTTMPSQAGDVVQPGDVVGVRVRAVATTRVSATSTKVKNMELALEQTPEVQGAFAAIDLKTRNVLALVGGFDNARSQLNRATQAKRQPGSSFKPFLYAAAIASGKYTPRTKVDDSPEVIADPWSGKSWKPQNFEKDEFAGPITLRKALAESKNTVAVKLLIELGLDKVRAQALDAGLTSTIPQSYTAALGTGEVGILEEINAYATIASLGRKQEPILIKRVVARDGGSAVYKNESAPEQSMRPDVAYLTADLMRSVIDDPEGTAHSLSALGRPASGKTGTASDHRDGWFVGFTPSIAAGAWVGFDEPKPMGAAETGGHCAGPIWLSWMRTAHQGKPVEDFPPPPPGVVQVRINRNTGALASPDDPFAVKEVYLAGTEPTAESAPQEAPSQEQFYQQGQ